jgi:hypothetical protein
MLNTSSSTYVRDSYEMKISYYQAIQMIINETSHYTLCSQSNIDICGSLYENNFDSSNPSLNRLLDDDYCSAIGQFKFVPQLYSNTTYILVVTTASSKETGAFSVIVSGPSTVIFERSSEYTFIRLLVISKKNEIEKM